MPTSARQRHLHPLIAGLAFVLLALACARPAIYIPPESVDGPDRTIRLDAPGNYRVIVQRDPLSAPWEALSFRNPGTKRLTGIQLWGLGGIDLLQLDEKTAEDAARGFTLLPDEQLVFTAVPADDETPALLTGTFSWQWPIVRRETPWPGRVYGAEVRPDGTIAFTRTNSWVQIELVSPLPLHDLRVAWGGEYVEGAIECLTSLDGRTWARRTPRRSVDPTHPFALGDVVRGEHRVWLRLALSSDVPAMSIAPVINQLRIERIVQMPGTIRLWPAGLSEVRLAWREPRDSSLVMHLLAP